MSYGSPPLRRRNRQCPLCVRERLIIVRLGTSGSGSILTVCQLLANDRYFALSRRLEFNAKRPLGSRPRASQLGGKRAYIARFGKDRSACQSGHWIASTDPIRRKPVAGSEA